MKILMPICLPIWIKDEQGEHVQLVYSEADLVLERVNQEKDWHWPWRTVGYRGSHKTIASYQEFFNMLKSPAYFPTAVIAALSMLQDNPPKGYTEVYTQAVQTCFTHDFFDSYYMSIEITLYNLQFVVDDINRFRYAEPQKVFGGEETDRDRFALFVTTISNLLLFENLFLFREIFERDYYFHCVKKIVFAEEKNMRNYVEALLVGFSKLERQIYVS